MPLASAELCPKQQKGELRHLLLPAGTSHRAHPLPSLRGGLSSHAGLFWGFGWGEVGLFSHHALGS